MDALFLRFGCAAPAAALIPPGRFATCCAGPSVLRSRTGPLHDLAEAGHHSGQVVDEGGVQTEQRPVVEDAVGPIVGPHAEREPAGLPAFNLAAQRPSWLGRQVQLLGPELA